MTYSFHSCLLFQMYLKYCMYRFVQFYAIYRLIQAICLFVRSFVRSWLSVDEALACQPHLQYHLYLLSTYIYSSSVRACPISINAHARYHCLPSSLVVYLAACLKGQIFLYCPSDVFDAAGSSPVRDLGAIPWSE